MLQVPLLVSLGIYKKENEVKLWKVRYGCCNLFASRDHCGNFIEHDLRVILPKSGVGNKVILIVSR